MSMRAEVGCISSFELLTESTACGRGHRMAHRKWKDTKLQPSMLPGPAVPGCSLVSFHFLWAILYPQAVVVSEKLHIFHSFKRSINLQLVAKWKVLQGLMPLHCEHLLPTCDTVVSVYLKCISESPSYNSFMACIGGFTLAHHEAHSISRNQCQCNSS